MSHHTPHLVSHVQRPNVRSAAPVAQRIEVKSASDTDIAMRAYEKYEARGRVDGFDEQDWAAASRELIRETFGHLSSPSLCPSERAS
jgi:hypothetical protein